MAKFEFCPDSCGNDPEKYLDACVGCWHDKDKVLTRKKVGLRKGPAAQGVVVGSGRLNDKQRLYVEMQTGVGTEVRLVSKDHID